MNKIKHFIKLFCPPILLQLLRKVLFPEKSSQILSPTITDPAELPPPLQPTIAMPEPSPPPPLNYQGVIPPFHMTRLHESRFSMIHEEHASRDLHINKDINLTRLRTYSVLMYAEISVNSTLSGDLLFCGIPMAQHH